MKRNCICFEVYLGRSINWKLKYVFFDIARCAFE